MHRGGQLRRRSRTAARLRPRHRGDRRADRLEARPVPQGRPVCRRERDIRDQYVRAVDRQAVRGRRPRAAQAVLRRALLQPAALHAPGRTDRDRRHRPGDRRPARDVSDDDAGQGLRARQGYAEFHRQPDRHLRHVRHRGRSTEGGPDDRRGRRPDRREARAREIRHLPHRRRGRPRHRRPRDEDDAGRPEGRPVRGALRDAGCVRGADCQGRARAEDRGRPLSQGRQGGAALRPRQRRIRAGRREGRRDRGAHPEEEGSGRAAEAAARVDQPAGAVRVGDPARLLALRRLQARGDRRQRARRRPGDALRLCHGAGPVRGLAAGRLGAGGRVDQGRHRRRPRAGRRAVAELGVRGAGGAARRRAPARGLVVAGARESSCRARRTRSTSASCFR